MRGISGVLSLALTLGCSTTSTISRLNGPDVEGDIAGGSPDSIFVARENGGEDEIPRNDISEIDYPGNVHANVGTVVLVYGLLNIAVGMPECSQRKDNQGAYCAGVFTPAVIGAGMIVWGMIVNQGQHSAESDTSRSSTLKDQGNGRFPAWASGRRRPPKQVTPEPEPADDPGPPPPTDSSATPTPPSPARSAEPPGTPPSAAPPPSPAGSGPTKAFPVEN